MLRAYVKLSGGIGNQLFQLAAGFAYCKLHDYQLIANANGWSAHQGRNPLEYRNNILQRFEFSGSWNPTHYITEDTFFIEQNQDVTLTGYFQDIKFLEPYVDEFIATYLPSPTNDSYHNQFVGVHWREGDFNAFADVHKICTDNYYIKALETFGPEAVGMAFSDTRKEFPKKFAYQTMGNEVLDLLALANFQNIICSNSSFSWWAARLGRPKKAIFPTKWLNKPETSFTIFNNLPAYAQWTTLTM
jgi:hypothetical protein